jgi:hypothetical protein
MKNSNSKIFKPNNNSNLRFYLVGCLLFFTFFYSFGQSFTASWPLNVNLNPTFTGAVTPATSVITAPLFSAGQSFSGAGLLGTGTGGKATTSCSAFFNSVGGTPITPYMEFRVSPLTGNNLTIAPFSFTVSSSTGLASGMTINAGYSINGGVSFIPLTITTASTGATANSLLVGSVFSTTNATTFTLSSPSNLTLAANTDFIVRIIYWRNNASSTSGNPITISSLNLSGFSCPGSLTVTPTSLTNFNTVPTAPSASQSFSLSGSALSTDVLLTAPTGYEINNPAVDANYYSSLTLTPSSGNLASTLVNVRIKTGQVTGVYNGNVTITCANAPTQTIALSGASNTNYYYNGVGPLHALTSWGTNPNGSGANPPDFGSATYAQSFYIVNTTNVSTTATFTIGNAVLSTNNKLFIGNGTSAAITFTMTQGNPLKVLSNSKFTVLAPTSGNNELIFQDSTIPTVNSPDISTNLTYAVNGGNVGVSGSTYNQLKITNGCTVTLSTSPNVKYLVVDSGASLVGPSANFITLSTGGNAVINGSIAGSRSQGIFTTDPTSTTKGTVFSTDTNATMILGCSSTVIYNRGSASAQNLSALNYANLIITNNGASTSTTVNLAGTARINGQLSFTGSVANIFSITTGTLTFGLYATLSNGNSSVVNFAGQVVTLETNSTLVSGVNLSGVTNATGVVSLNVLGTASTTDAVVCKGRSATLNLTNATGAVQWQQSSDNSSWVDILLANSSSYISPSLSSTMYFRANVSTSNCSTASTNVVAITINTKKWNGTAWDGDTLPPTASESIEFQGNFTSSSDVNGCSCTVTSGNVTISSGNTLNLVDALYVNGGSIGFNDSASLVQANSIVPNTAYDSTKISFQRTTPPIRKFDYIYWSSPVSGQSLLNLSPNTLADKYFSFDSSINNWAVENPNSSMSIGKGYIIRGPQSFDAAIASPFTGVFNGVPNNGTISATINGASGIFNLLGNPYPSALDSELVYEDNSSSIKPNFCFWTHYTPITANNYTTNDYAIYNAVLGTGIGISQSAVSIGGTPGNFRYIASGQSFFVEGLGVGSVVFKNAHRVINSNSNFFRLGNLNPNVQSSTLESSKLWLNVTNSEGLFKQQLLCYLGEATNDYDELYDAKEIEVDRFINFFSLASNDIKYAIQSRVTFTDQDVVQLGFSSTIAGIFSISLANFDGLFFDQDVYLVDHYLGVYKNLKEQSYEFVTNIGSFNDRFSIQYVVPNLLVPSNTSTKGVLVYSNNNELFIKSFFENINKVDVFDVFGRLIFHENQIDNKLKVIDGIRMKELVFIVIELVNGNKIIKKIFI